MLVHRFPQCLFFLDMLQKPSFRKEMAVPDYVSYVENQQLLQWLHYSNNRTQPPPETDHASH